MPMGVGQGNTAEGGTTGTSRSLADIGGAEGHTLAESEMPAHNHWGGQFTEQGYNFTGNGIETRTSGWGGQSVSGWRGAHGAGAPGQATTQNTGGGGSHNITSPFIVVNFIIKT
jgi:microcystin-dependent protein